MPTSRYQILLDLEEWRKEQGLTYEALAEALCVSNASRARAYALGIERPPSEVVERILRISDGRVGLLAMHQRRMAYLRSRPQRGIEQRSTGGDKALAS